MPAQPSEKFEIFKAACLLVYLIVDLKLKEFFCWFFGFLPGGRGTQRRLEGFAGCYQRMRRDEESQVCNQQGIN